MQIPEKYLGCNFRVNKIILFDNTNKFIKINSLIYNN